MTGAVVHTERWGRICLRVESGQLRYFQRYADLCKRSRRSCLKLHDLGIKDRLANRDRKRDAEREKQQRGDAHDRLGDPSPHLVTSR